MRMERGLTEVLSCTLGDTFGARLLPKMCRFTADPEVDLEASRCRRQNPQSETVGLIRRSLVAGRICMCNQMVTSEIRE